jgi:hypothetical protein
MRSFLLVFSAILGLSQPARVQGGRVPADSATLSRLHRDLREAHRSGVDSVRRYREVLAVTDSLIEIHRYDVALRRIRLLAAAPVVGAGVQSARLVSSCTTILGLKAMLGDYRNISTLGAGCEDCVRAAGQLRIAKFALDSLSRVKKCPSA